MYEVNCSDREGRIHLWDGSEYGTGRKVGALGVLWDPHCVGRSTYSYLVYEEEERGAGLAQRTNLSAG